MIYFLVSSDGAICKIGYAADVRQRFKQHRSSYPWEFYAAICGSEANEQEIHRHFADLIIDGTQEHFRLEGQLHDYLEWLGTRAYAACSLDELADAYAFPGRFPWDAPTLIQAGQQALDLSDEIVPRLRRPLSRSARVLATIRSDSDEWYTPAIYTDAAREVMGAIDLDPASCALANLTVRAKEIITAAEDGLRFHWHGRVWMNPPYGNEKDKFVDHLLAEYEARRVTEAVMCLNSHATDTKWFQPLWELPICFTHHRVRFIGGLKDKTPDDSASTTGTAFVYVGANPQRFADVFSKFGPIVSQVRPASMSSDDFRRLQKTGADWEIAA